MSEVMGDVFAPKCVAMEGDGTNRKCRDVTCEIECEHGLMVSD